MKVAIPIDIPKFFDLGFDLIDDHAEIHTGGTYPGIYIYGLESKKYNRFTFEKLDSIKMSRGEYLSFGNKRQNSWGVFYEIENSEWLKERYEYEKRHYEKSYEFNGDVEDILRDYKHLYFNFGGQFIEVICRGFWCETSFEPLFGKRLIKGHPFRDIEKNNSIIIEHAGLVGHIFQNMLSQNQLIEQALYCSQKLFSFGIEVNNHINVNHVVQLMNRNDEVKSSLRGHFGAELKTFDKVAQIEDVKLLLLNYMEEVAKRKRVKGI